MKSLACKDVGVDCDYVATGKDEAEVIAVTQEHAKKQHGMIQIPDDLLIKVKAAIKETPEFGKKTA